MDPCPGCRHTPYKTQQPVVPIGSGGLALLACPTHQSDIIARSRAGQNISSVDTPGGEYLHTLPVGSPTVAVNPAVRNLSARGSPIPEAGVNTPPSSGDAVSSRTRHTAASPSMRAVAP